MNNMSDDYGYFGSDSEGYAHYVAATGEDEYKEFSLKNNAFSVVFCSGGQYWTRTNDFHLVEVALYQLS